MNCCLYELWQKIKVQKMYLFFNTCDVKSKGWDKNSTLELFFRLQWENTS